MNIYDFCINGEHDYVAAETVFDALMLYCRTNDLNVFDFEQSDDIKLIPESEWHEYYVTDDFIFKY